MKKLWIICTTLIMMSSCIEHAHIYQKLSDEDAAAIPYQLGQRVDFVNQDGDTLTYEVVFDDTYPYDQDRFFSRTHEGTGMIPKDDYYCYARTVILECEQNHSLGFTILPGKDLIFYLGNEFDLNGNLLSYQPYTSLDDTEYTNVHHEILYSQYTGQLIYDWYYNEAFGLLFIQYYDQSLTRVPSRQDG